MKYNQDSEESLSEIEPIIISETTRTPSQSKKTSSSKFIKFLIILTIIVALLFILWKIFGVEIIKKILNYLQKSVDERSFSSYIFYILICFVFTCFIIPGASYFYIGLSFFMKNFWEPFFIIFLSKKIFKKYFFSRKIFQNYFSKEIFQKIFH